MLTPQRILNATMAFILAIAATGATSAFAGGYDYKLKIVDNARGYRLKIKEKKVYDFGSWQQVGKVKIKVRGEVPGFAVHVNGQACATSFHGGYDPYYDCDVNAEAWAVEIYNGDADCFLRDIEYEYAYSANYARWDTPVQDLKQIAQDARVLREGVDPVEGMVFVDVEVAARRAGAVIYGGGAYSADAAQAVTNLFAKITVATPMVEKCFSIPMTARAAQDLQTRVYHLAKTFGIPAP